MLVFKGKSSPGHVRIGRKANNVTASGWKIMENPMGKNHENGSKRIRPIQWQTGRNIHLFGNISFVVTNWHSTIEQHPLICVPWLFILRISVDCINCSKVANVTHTKRRCNASLASTHELLSFAHPGLCVAKRDWETCACTVRYRQLWIASKTGRCGTLESANYHVYNVFHRASQ